MSDRNLKTEVDVWYRNPQLTLRHMVCVLLANEKERGCDNNTVMIACSVLAQPHVVCCCDCSIVPYSFPPQADPRQALIMTQRTPAAPNLLMGLKTPSVKITSRR